MQKILSIILLLFFIAGPFHSLRAQQQPVEENTYKPLQIPINEGGEKYIRFLLWNQFWLTSHNLEADNSKWQITPSIRRLRLITYAQVSPRFLILTHFGLNSLTPSNLTPTGTEGNGAQFFLHGAWGEWKVNDHLYLGSGLHYWNGLTRLSNASTTSFMTLDQSRPFTSWHSLGITDQFARHLGVYAKGAIGRFDYRLALNAPMHKGLGEGHDYGLKDSNLTYTGSSNPDAAGNPTGNTIIEGYFRYNFFDEESTKLPYTTGTYLGTKKIVALGTGFFLHPDGMYKEATQTHHPVRHVAADVYVDMPLDDQTALHAYASIIHFDYGNNYVSRWAGTGTVLYGQAGYLLQKLHLMPYLALQSGQYDGFDKPVQTLDAGVNYFLNGHHAKLTLEYHRIKGDIREAGINTQEESIAQMRLQFQVAL